LTAILTGTRPQYEVKSQMPDKKSNLIKTVEKMQKVIRAAEKVKKK